MAKIYTVVCFLIFSFLGQAQDTSVIDFMNKIKPSPAIDTTKVKIEKCDNDFNFYFECFSDGVESDDFYIVKRNIENDSIVEVEWHFDGEYKLILTPQYIDDWVLVKMHLRRGRFLMRQINGFLVVNVINGDSYFVGVNFSLPIPMPNGSVDYTMDINSILMLNNNSLRPTSGYRIYGNSMIGRSDCTYNRYLVRENFCLIPSTSYYLNSLTLDNFTFDMIKTSLQKNSSCLFNKEIVHQSKPDIPLWIHGWIY